MRKIVLLLAVCMCMSCMCIVSNAAVIDQPTIQWDYTDSITGAMSFDGTNGNYTRIIRGNSDVTKITATAELSYKDTNGDWVDIDTDWTYSVNSRTLVIDEDFTAVRGREYRVILNVIVYVGNIGEPIRKVTFGTCPLS